MGTCVSSVSRLDDKEANAGREIVQHEINTAEYAVGKLYSFYNDVKKNWATTASRVVGHVVFSPPFRLGAGTTKERYTEDYAIIEVDDDKIERTDFNGNVIDLGTEIPFWEFNKRKR